MMPPFIDLCPRNQAQLSLHINPIATVSCQAFIKACFAFLADSSFSLRLNTFLLEANSRNAQFEPIWGPKQHRIANLTHDLRSQQCVD